MNRTGTEQKRDTQGDTHMSKHVVNSLKSLEAGTGIEPVYSDLQSGA